MTSEIIEFVKVGDLIHDKIGIYVDELGEKKVLLSPAMYNQWKENKEKFYRHLHVKMPSGEIRSVLDLPGEL